MPRGWRLLRLREPEGPALLGAIHPDSPRLISLIEGTSLVDVLELGDIEARAAAAETVEALDEETLELPEPWELVVPLDAPETWAAGVTYERSREARLEESRTEARDAYSLVYDAERPELFLKDAAGRRTAGPGGTIGVRSDSTWTVPEPEVALVLGTDGRLLGATIGNDVSSRDIEGMNPLYLPQAKIFGGACALGPAVLAPQDWSDPFDIELRIVASDGGTVYSGVTSTGRMKRSFADLVAFLLRDNPVPPGSVLLTGTGVVPDDVSLEPGQTVEIRVAGIGTLVNRVAPAAEVLVW